MTLPEAHADSQGLNPTHLGSILSQWETTHPGKAYPKLLYTIPSGSNPTGASIPEHRKIEVYVSIGADQESGELRAGD
jgi:tryptophan aminotransferase